MTWFLFGLFCGLFQSFGDVVTKRAGQRYHPYVIALVSSISALSIFAPLTWYFGFEIKDRNSFFLSTSIVTIINLYASVLYIKSLSCADLSLSLPITKLSPLFILVTGPIINAEWPSICGSAGVILSIVGTYSLNFSMRKIALWRPLLELWINPGMRRMLIVALLWAVSSPFDKIAVQSSSPLTYLLCMVGALSVLQSALILCTSEAKAGFSMGAWRHIMPRGLLTAIAAILQMLALPLAPVAYVITLKRTSVFWGILWGKVIFNEQIKKERLIGALLTFLGMYLILISG